MLRKLTILLVLSGLAPAILPQQPYVVSTKPQEASQSLTPPSEPVTVTTPTSDEREGLIHLDVAARDQTGSPFGDLSAKDLTLQQDGTATKVLSFHRSNSNDEDERLNEVCLVLDEVDLSPMQFAFVKNEAINFLRRNDGVLAQPVSILWVKTDGVYGSAFPSTDGNDLAQDIATNHVSPTALKFYMDPQPNVTPRDARSIEVLRTVYAAAVNWRDKPGRKALLWLGYGWSALGKLDAKGDPFPVLVELATRIREARMVIYEITPWQDPETPVDYQPYLPEVRSQSDPRLASPVPFFALPVLAIRSGGLVLDNSKNMEGDINRCIVDASEFYTVSFDPPHAAEPDEYHDLAVLMGATQSKVRTSYGYYNQPVFYDEPRVPQKRLDIADVHQLLQTDRGERDRELAGQLNSLELTERLSTPQLASWKTRLHAKEAKAALTVLGDESVFLAPPMAEISDQPPPDESMQGQTVLRAEKYLDEVVPMLPDFSADATTVKYEQLSVDNKDTWKTTPPNRNLIQAASEQATFLYRDGREQRIVEKKADAARHIAVRNDLNYKGIFGPILGFVFEDVRRGSSKLIWTRWERTSQGTLAVFHYRVRTENPLYGVVYCCLAGGKVFQTLPEHHGEVAINPDTGAILRISVESGPGWIRETDLSPLRPVLFSNMMVEYGPVDIGGRTFICPHRSVVMTRQRTVRPIRFWGLSFDVYGPYQTLMNDTIYTRYHKFGSDSRILPGFEVVQDGKTPTSEKDHPQPRNQP
ncbi:MAG TPA: hypothetical protein VHZ52_12495 [Acidobacteriaceae bacterium]|jgi:VWFA-related protein|nr:hypothetical protein [Acidobacteriaceae bacterium]